MKDFIKEQNERIAKEEKENIKYKLQKDDGSRNALEVFFKDTDVNFYEFSKLLIDNTQYWKARVLLEMVWELKDKFTA